MNKLIIFITFVFSLGELSQAQNTEIPEEEMSNITRAEEAYKSQDLKVIRELCSDMHSRGSLIGLISHKPSSPWKEEVTLAIIEMPWPADQLPGKPAPPGINSPLMSYQLAIELLGPILLDENLKFNDSKTYRKLSNLEERKKLAAKYRESRKEDGAVRTDTEGFQNGRRPQGDLSVPPREDFSLFPERDQAPNSSRSEADPNGMPNSAQVVVLLGVIIGVPIVVFLFRKLKSRYQN